MSDNLMRIAQNAALAAAIAIPSELSIKPSKQRLKHYNAISAKVLTTRSASSFADKKATKVIGSSNQNVAITEGNSIYW